MNTSQLKVFKFEFQHRKSSSCLHVRSQHNQIFLETKYRQVEFLVDLQPVIQRMFQRLVVVRPPPELLFQLLDSSVFGVCASAVFQDCLLNTLHSGFQSNMEIFFLLDFEVVGLTVEEAAEEAANEEAVEVFVVADNLRDQLVPTWGFFGFRDKIALQILLFEHTEVLEILEALSA